MDIFAVNLIKEYEGRRVLNIPELHLKKGSLCGIIGANGAGKSTLLNLIAGLLKPTDGNLYYHEYGKQDPPYERMTMVFQKPYMLRTTVEKNIAYPMRLRGFSRQTIEKRTAFLAGELGLTEFLKKKSWTLSGGEMQKVALARALSFHPELLLLDEPTANVDPGTTAEIERMLMKINEEEATTVIIVTHNLAQAKRLCNEVIFMNRGEIIEFSESQKLLKTPDDPLTKKFIAGELLL